MLTRASGLDRGQGGNRLKTYGRARSVGAAAFAALTIGALGPGAASAAVSVKVSGDDGNPVPLGGAVNLRNMNPRLTINSLATDHFDLSVAGPGGAKVASDLKCYSNYNNGESPKLIDYIGNGDYTVTLTTYTTSSCTVGASPQSLSFRVTASTSLGTPQNAVLTRKAGSIIPNTVSVPIDLNPGALSTEVFVGRNVAANPDGSLPATAKQAFVDSTTKTVPVRLDQGPGNYVVAARAKGYSGTLNPQAFSPWAAPVTIKTFDPFDLERFTWTDQRGPSYRLTAKVRSAGASGRVSVAIGKGTKGKYKSYGTVKLSSKHTFSKRFRLSGTGKYRIRFKYKGNANVAGGFEVRKFQIRKTFRFSSASIAG